MRLLLILLRTSYRPCLEEIGRQTGIPTGQPNSTVPMSWPMMDRSAGGNSLSQSRTGSTPPVLR
jgi:hypothetical protein